MDDNEALAGLRSGVVADALLSATCAAWHAGSENGGSRREIREVPDFPSEGIGFEDLMPLLADPDELRETIDQLAEWARPRAPEIDARRRGPRLHLRRRARLAAGERFRPRAQARQAAVQRSRRPTRSSTGRTVSGASEPSPGRTRHRPRRRPRDRWDRRAKVELVEHSAESWPAPFVIELEFLKGRERLSGYDVTP